MTKYGQVAKNVEAKRSNTARKELAVFEAMLSELKTQYEQFFLGIIPKRPDKLHSDVGRKLRSLYKLPFKSSAQSFKLKTLENRYSTYNNYWQRVLRQKEEGTYSRDVFKAAIRQKEMANEVKERSTQGVANKQMKELYSVYKHTFEKSSGKQMNVDFNNFRSSLVKKAQTFRNTHGSKKIAFKVVVKNGKVTVSAQAK